MGPHDLSKWVREYTSQLLRYASARVNDRAVAEDLVQITFMSAWQSVDKFKEQSSPRTWLFSILKHKLADHYRKAYRDPVIHNSNLQVDDRFDDDGRWVPEHRPTENDMHEADDAEAMNRYLAHCLKLLPDHWRAAIEMKYLKERDAEAICQELGISVTNYWQQVHRAKVKLRECISKQGAAHS